MKARFTWMTLLLTGFLTLAGCGGNNEVDLTTDTTMTDTGLTGIEQETVAIANLEPTQGNNTRGTVTFTQMGEVVRIQANITGLAPGQHGFHIHENGDCSAPDATSDIIDFAITEPPRATPPARPTTNRARRAPARNALIRC